MRENLPLFTVKEAVAGTNSDFPFIKTNYHPPHLDRPNDMNNSPRRSDRGTEKLLKNPLMIHCVK